MSCHRSVRQPEQPSSAQQAHPQASAAASRPKLGNLWISCLQCKLLSPRKTIPRTTRVTVITFRRFSSLNIGCASGICSGIVPQRIVPFADVSCHPSPNLDSGANLMDPYLNSPDPRRIVNLALLFLLAATALPAHAQSLDLRHPAPLAAWTKLGNRRQLRRKQLLLPFLWAKRGDRRRHIQLHEFARQCPAFRPHHPAF